MPAAPGAPHDQADVVFRVGRAYGMTADRGIYQAVAVKGGRISAVGGSRDELDTFIGPGTAVIDDPELVLYPAFNDTHNHQLLAARDLDYVSLEQARSVDELVQALRAAADRTPSGEWVISSCCWHETHLREGRLPTAQELDAASARHPIFVQRGGHVGVANSAALRMAGITATSADPPSGTVVRLGDRTRSACSSRVARSSRSAGCFRRCRRLSRLSCSRGSAGSTTAAASASSVTPG
jgi:predicted amidohydrolase YtcJ